MSYNVSTIDELILTLTKFPAMSGYSMDVFYHSFARNIKYVKNWRDVYKVSFGKVDSARIFFRDGKVFELNRNNYLSFQLLVIMMALTKKYGKRMKIKRHAGTYEFIINGKKVISKEGNAAAFAGEFLNDLRKKIDVTGKDVIDVGAYAGDTALYYAIVGKAGHVYAFEPVPEHYKDAVGNVKLNKMANKITLFNEAVGTKNGIIKIDANKESANFNEQVEKEIGVSTMKMTSLSNVVKKLGIHDGILKMDIEGGEYDTIKNTPNDVLRKFSAMHIEYHYGYKDLVKRLRSIGYDVWYTHPKFSFRMFVGRPKIVGDIIAIRA